jgi:hypothetical protein
MKGLNVWLAVISADVIILVRAHEVTDASMPWDRLFLKEAMEHFNFQHILSATSAPLTHYHSSFVLGLFIVKAQITCSYSGTWGIAQSV